MKRIGLLFLLMAFVFSLSPGFAANGNSFVRFGDLHGEVNVRPNDADDDAYVFAELSTSLQHDDRIRTQLRSGAILSFSDMTTFVMKEDTTIVLDIKNERESKVGLVAGNVWVNLKRMVADGSMEIEMSQAVAGIKGTNITCASDPDAKEDRVKVLRGHANVRIKETNEMIEVLEGEELVIKEDVKPEKLEIDIEEEQKDWEEDLSNLGSSIDIDDLPELLLNINESSATQFGMLNEAFQDLTSLESVELLDAQEMQVAAERFIGVLFENILILNNAKQRVTAAMEDPNLSADQKAQLITLDRDIAAALAGQQTYQSEAIRMMRYEFLTSAVSDEFMTELEMIRTELAQISSELEGIRAVLSGNLSGQSQDWYLEASDSCVENEMMLAELAEMVADILEVAPENQEAQALLKSIADEQNSIADMMKSLGVAEVDDSIVTEMQQIDYEISEAIVTLESEIDNYNYISDIPANTRAFVVASERRLRASLEIMSIYVNARRLYTQAQRNYDSTMRSAGTTGFLTSEQEELESLWMNINDRFQQLGIVAEELQMHIENLENQMNDLPLY